MLMVIDWLEHMLSRRRYLRPVIEELTNVGFPAHRMLQTLGALLGFAGFVVAIVCTEDTGSG